jgi:hypothetical protein
LAALTPEERLEHYDEELDKLKQRFVDAVGRLADEPTVDHSFGERLRGLVERLDELRVGLQPEDFDKDQIVALFGALFTIRNLVDAADGTPDLDTCDQLLVNIERIRHVFRDALDEHVTGVASDRGLVVRDLREWLPHASLATIAELVDVDRRTLHRWSQQSGPPPARLALVARLVAILRHAWTEAGILAWFDRPRRDLDGRRPRMLLGDPTAEDALIMAARSGRSQYAS